jgi:steroid delta-isomerase-like uncharacterized protein
MSATYHNNPNKQTPNKQIVYRLYEEVFNRQEAAAIDQLIAPDIIVHDPMIGEMHGIDAFRQFAALFIAGFPQQHTTVELLVEEGDLVAALHTHTGVNAGPFMGLPPTGRAIQVRGIELLRVINGKITELWRHDDDAGLLRQLGIIPTGETAEA